jgi:hypothetical protein
MVTGLPKSHRTHDSPPTCDAAGSSRAGVRMSPSDRASTLAAVGGVAALVVTTGLGSCASAGSRKATTFWST